MVVETNGAPDARGRRARERRMRDARKKKTMFTPARSPSRRAASPAFDPSMRHRSSDRAIRPIASRPPPPLATPRAWMVARVDDHSRRRARETTRDDATNDATRDTKNTSRRSRRLARHRASRSSPFDPSIHPSARARAPSPAVVRPPARRLIFHAQTARHTRAGSRSTPTSGPAGHHPTYFDGVKCYLFRVDDTVSASTTTRLWTLYTMVDLVHDT